mgnify:CR=1 FL=1
MYLSASFLLFFILPHLLAQLLQIELSMCLDVVEASTVHTHHSRLSHKCVGVNLVDKLEDEVRLALFGYTEYHLYVFLCIETVAIEHRATAVGYLVYRLAYLLILVGYDEELHTSAQRVYQMIDYKRYYKQQNVAVEHLLPLVPKNTAPTIHAMNFWSARR